SHNSPQAAQAIKRFKRPSLNVLVTIAMAYEGLDVPQVTHICCLTQIRSTPWIEQMVARAVRIDKEAGPYSSQRAHVFAPRDQKFMEIIARIREEQAPILKEERASSGGGSLPSEGEGGQAGPEITPIGSTLTNTREVHVGGSPTGQLEFFSDIPMIHTDPVETVKEKETRIREEINSLVNRFAFQHRYEPQRINMELKRSMGKARDLMTLPELENLLVYVRKYYPAEMPKTLKDFPEGASLPRAKRKRVSTRAVNWTPREEIMKFSCYAGRNR
ncbi:MAG: helicase-related protein, partial [Pseudomonadota bacterium]